ncbi:MAG: glycosyltransferase family 39 protein [Patescibacteria group bacterium]|nr:glycosyltransferase family 39 protein [Patescibacteria group bacterium]
MILQIDKLKSGLDQKRLLILLVFLIFFVPRIVSLGWDLTNIDAHHWRPRMWNFWEGLESGNFGKTYQKYHPGVTLMWISGSSERVFDHLSEFLLGYNTRNLPKWYPYRHFAAKAPLVIVISILGAYCYFVLKKATTSTYALIFSILLSLEPFFLGVSRYLHLSALTSMFMFSSFITLYLYTLEKKRWQFVLSAVFLGLAVLTKVNGVIVAFTNALLLVSSCFDSLDDLGDFSRWKKFFVRGFGYAAISVFVFFALWPAMWVEPLGVVRKMLDKGIGDTAFDSDGAVMLVPTRYLFYFETFFLRSSPITALLFVLSLPLALFSDSDLKNIKKLLLFSLSFLFFSWLFLSIPDKVKDRYLISMYPAFFVYISFALYEILQLVPKRAAVLILFFLGSYYGLTIYRYHPQYSFYWNDAIGGQHGLKALGLPTIRRGEYFYQAAFYINKLSDEPRDKNTVIFNFGMEPCFKFAFYGKTFTSWGFMPDGYHAHYIVTSPEYLDKVPSFCEFKKTFGVRSPNPYPAVRVFECGKKIDNTFEEEDT